nr:hypothetical protein [Ferruginibacter sp.]
MYSVKKKQVKKNSTPYSFKKFFFFSACYIKYNTIFHYHLPTLPSDIFLYSVFIYDVAMMNADEHGRRQYVFKIFQRFSRDYFALNRDKKNRNLYENFLSHRNSSSSIYSSKASIYLQQGDTLWWRFLEWNDLIL